MIAYGGLLRTIYKQLNLDDTEDGDLVHVDGDNLDEEEKAYLIVAQGIGI